MTNGIFSHGRGVQTKPTRGRHGTPHSLADTVGMRKNTRAWVLHVGFAEPRTTGRGCEIIPTRESGRDQGCRRDAGSNHDGHLACGRSVGRGCVCLVCSSAFQIERNVKVRSLGDFANRSSLGHSWQGVHPWAVGAPDVREAEYLRGRRIRDAVHIIELNRMCPRFLHRVLHTCVQHEQIMGSFF